ncbi:hypothetical protein ACIPEN_20870 [Herbaspirillum chlorophenolicum]|uniref:Transmembrane protein n=1 Tax=Herbaspirillum chlorophenolicum TaxID=211589 RepID=A0ABW8F4R8_9BURK|nr:hypothetical protein [Herbaspirillum chlorophenolicum]
MISPKSLLLAFGLASTAVAAALSMMARGTSRRERRLQRIELQRWENEGGNAYPVPGVPVARRRTRR